MVNTAHWRRRYKRLERAAYKAIMAKDYCRYAAVCKARARLSYRASQETQEA